MSNIDVKMIKNSFKRNPVGNTALILFITLSAMLVVSASLIFVQLTTSITGMYDVAQPPHFLQMHKGTFNQEKIDAFNESYEGVVAWQTSPMINIYGDDLKIEGEESFTLSDSRLDISLVKQNDTHDLLLDRNRNRIEMNQGEIGIPVLLRDSYAIRIGDTIELVNQNITKTFTVTSFVQDAQMNSPLVYSTRLLISDEDFNELLGQVGESEYLIESYFTDRSMATAFQTAYENAGLPQDGPTITYNQIFLISAFADILQAFIIFLVSILLVMLALISIKYTLLGSLEEEIGEIGTMKAIGMTDKDIKYLYLKKYRGMLAIGILLGYGLALLASNFFTAHIQNTFGNQRASILTIVIPILTCGLIYIIGMQYTKNILKRLKKVTVIDALVLGKGFSQENRIQDGLYRSKNLPINVLLSLRDIFYNFKGFILVFLSMLIVSAMIAVPMNLTNTLKSKEFIPYMGSPVADILIEVDLGENLNQRYDEIQQLIERDKDVTQVEKLRTVRVETLNADNQWMNLRVETGETAGSGLKYLYGSKPQNENELSLSKLNADEMDVKPGETTVIRVNGVEQKVVVSGIYQDVTSGGLTAKSIHDFPDVAAEKYQLIIYLNAGVDAEEKAVTWTQTIGTGYDIQPMAELVDQTLGVVARQVQAATLAIIAIGLVMSAFIIVLFMKLRLIKDSSQIAILKAIGFTNLDVRKQYLYKVSVISLIGITIGTIISSIIGEKIISFVFNLMGLGISKLTFIINPWLAYVMVPLVLFVVCTSTTWFTSHEIKKQTIISLIDE